MEITILGQGFTANGSDPVGRNLIKFLSQKHFHTFMAISAFASIGGINGLSQYIKTAKKHFKRMSIVVGVNERGTSKEALDALRSLPVNSYVFYYGKSPIFHPKIYLFEGDKISKLIIGSSNLKSRGLYSNTEASLLITIDNTASSDRKIIQDLKDYFKGIFEFNDPNLKKLTTKLLQELVKLNIVPTEAERQSEQAKKEKPQSKETANLIAKIFPKRAIPKMPSDFRSKKRKAKSKKTTDSLESDTGKLVWTRKKLPASSVQQTPVGKDTGGLRLVQDHFTIKGKKISQTKYFRYDLFNKYKWKEIRRSPFVEAAIIPFEVVIFGEFKGKYDLEVRHKPSGEARQGNYTTSISWGSLGEIVKNANFTGSRLDLYAPKGKSKPFRIEIS